MFFSKEMVPILVFIEIL